VPKKLSCRLGRHSWTTRVEEGESSKVCAACGKTQRKRSKSVSEEQWQHWEDRPGGGGGLG
jgi:hypothetical protein